MTVNEITPADRIRELNAISEEFAAVMQHAAQAIKALSSDAGEDAGGVEARKTTFEDNSSAFLTAIQSGSAHLHRQAYALEEAGIIAAEAPTLSSAAQQRQQSPSGAVGRGAPGASQQAEPERITNGGLGNLDVGWLNSRGNKVGAEKEAELIGDAKELAQQVIDERQPAT